MRLVLLGSPGAGKGTEATRIATRFSIPRLSTEDMVRDAVASRTALGRASSISWTAGNLYLMMSSLQSLPIE